MEGKFSVKVFANKGIIMLRSHSAPPSRPSLLLSFTATLSLPPFFSCHILLSDFSLFALWARPWFPPHSNPCFYPCLPVPKTVFIFRRIPVPFISFSSPPRRSSSPPPPLFLRVLGGLGQYSAAVKPLYQRIPATVTLTVTFAVELPDLPHACTRSCARSHTPFFVCGTDAV